VALVGHAYRASPGKARVVRADDPLHEVGDEALLAARALEAEGACVVVAPRRAEAISLASRLADVLVVDGVLQTAPVRSSLALLAVDAAEPWGRVAKVPPLGHLRAPIDALLAACDRVVRVGDEPGADARVVLRGARANGVFLGWEELAASRPGLLCALARPERVARTLARRGVEPRTLLRARDHGPFGRTARALAARAAVDLWLTTPKCALHLPRRLSAPVAILEHEVVLSPLLRSALERLVPCLDRRSPGQ
jgi:tetraacyldisaccharide-1-P 4'-kinase